MQDAVGPYSHYGPTAKNRSPLMDLRMRLPMKHKSMSGGRLTQTPMSDYLLVVLFLSLTLTLVTEVLILLLV